MEGKEQRQQIEQNIIHLKEKRKSENRLFILFQIMVHFISIALFLFITWHAQPGASKIHILHV